MKQTIYKSANKKTKQYFKIWLDLEKDLEKHYKTCSVKVEIIIYKL